MSSQTTKNKLSGSKVTNLDSGRMYLVDNADNPTLYAEFKNDELVIPRGYFVFLKDGVDSEARIGDGFSVWSEAISFGGGAEPEPVTWTTISGKPAVVAEGATQAAARSSIGAGTGNSNLAVATTNPAALAASASAGTGTTAARADHVHPYPTAAQVGAAAVSHTHTGSQVTLTGYAIGTAAAVAAADSLNAAIGKLEARIVALETTP